MIITPLILPQVNWQQLRDLAAEMSASPLRTLDERRITKADYFKFLAFFRLIDNPTGDPRKLVQTALMLLEHLHFTFTVALPSDREIAELLRVPRLKFMTFRDAYQNCMLVSGDALDWQTTIIEVLTATDSPKAPTQLCTEAYRCFQVVGLGELFVQFNAQQISSTQITLRP